MQLKLSLCCVCQDFETVIFFFLFSFSSSDIKVLLDRA